MSLKPYHQKRNFKKTPEPKGGAVAASRTKRLFIIQKHAASHLHYDFRIELNGVLKSWAVPKGPCLDPTVKRLAMHVEDHPIEYGTFEGIIPEGEYGGGTVMLWDKGKWICEDNNPTKAYLDGNLTFRLEAKKCNGLWKLIRIKKAEKSWLLIKINDEYARPLDDFDITEAEPLSVKSEKTMEEIAEDSRYVWGKQGLQKQSPRKKTIRKKKSLKHLKELPTIKLNLRPSRFPSIIYPELATLVNKPPESSQWLHEIKFDGYRLLAFKRNNDVRLFTRRGNDWTNKFSNVAAAILDLPIPDAIFDGEVVVLDDNQHSNFQLLQNSLKTRSNQSFIYYVFDLLYYDQYNLMSQTLLERKNILHQLLSNEQDSVVRYSDHIFGSGKKIFEKSCELGLEGIVSKDANSIYEQKRTKCWLKTKCIKRQEFVIGGYTLPQGGRKYFGSLLLGTYNQKGQLIYNGNCGTGFTQASLKDIYNLLKNIKSPESPFHNKPPGSNKAIWIKPSLVAEVEFTDWTDDNILRHPSFKGLRTDKAPKDIIKEKASSIVAVTKHMQTKKYKSLPIKITNPNRLYYPEIGLTKLDILDYYEEVKNWILPYVINRVLTLVRCPENFHDCFYQRHVNKSMPSEVHGIKVKEKGKNETCIYIKDVKGLLTLPQLGALEIHPWGSTIKNLEYPDIIVFDLDPAPEVHWKDVVNAAKEVKILLKQLKLISFVKTTGGKGLHVVVPITPDYTWDQIKNFTHTFVDYLVMQKPHLYIGKMTKAKRKGKIYIDYLRNQRGATAIAPYSTRARENAPVATPVDWDELTTDKRDTFYTVKTLPERLAKLKKDPWRDFFKKSQKLKLDDLG